MNYFKELNNLFLATEASDVRGEKISLDEAISIATDLVISRHREGNNVFFIGNGGSASIANHMVTDFLKNAEISAMAFNDPSLITCLSNDFGYEHVFERPLSVFAKNGDVVFAISSSGKSENILKGVEIAKKNKCRVITLTGFDPNNPLRLMGDVNIYVPSDSYGYVESAHSVICHCIADMIVKENKGNG